MSAPPPLAWLVLGTEDLGRFVAQQHARWPFPLESSGVGQWDMPFQEYLGEVDSPVAHRPRGEQRLLDSLVAILREPAYCAYLIRAEGEVETYYAVVANADEAVLVLDLPGEVHLARVPATHIATVLAAQLPKVFGAPTVRMSLPPQTAALLGAGISRQAPERTLRSAMASAGIPDTMASRLLAGPEAVSAYGTVGAVAYSRTGMGTSPRCSSWTEMPDGGMISSKNREGDVVWEPMSTAALARAVADALTGLGS